MRVFIFKGDPTGYQWNFPLQKGKPYSGDLIAHSGMTIGQLVDADDTYDPGFKSEWEEVKTLNLKSA